MHDFDYDAWQKKIIARSASKRVGKKKGCHLPSDNLTPSQKRKLSGECKSVNLNKAITWEEYKELPKDLATEYYNHLVTEFKVGEGKIANDLFGITKSALIDYNHRHNIDFIKCGKGRKGFNKAKWESFVGKPLAVRSVEPVEVEAVEAVENPEIKNSTLNSFSFRFDKVTDMTAIINLIGNLPLPENAEVIIEVRSKQDKPIVF